MPPGSRRTSRRSPRAPAPATDEGSTWVANPRSRPSSARSAERDGSPLRYGYAYGSRYTSGANGPNPDLYGLYREVIVIVSRVRPWNPPSKQTTAGRPV